MHWRDFPLHEPPHILTGGIGRHGHLPLENYILPDLWCLHLFHSPMDLRVGAERYAVTPGMVTLIPPNTPIQFHFPVPLRHTHCHALFVARGPRAPFPAAQQLTRHYDAATAQFQDLLSLRASNPRRADARLWDLLWQLAGAPDENASDAPAALVKRAKEQIELKLGTEIVVADLAAELGVSHNHLTRRFRAETGQTVVEFVRHRRVAMACQLLRHSNLPAKAIAAHVGLGDLHALNKAVRRVTGRPPSSHREFA